MLDQQDTGPLKELREKLHTLHEKARAGTLSAEERPFYERTRDDLARMLLFAQQMTRAPGQKFRAALRVRTELDVAIALASAEAQTKTINLSVGGFAAELANAPAVGAKARVKLSLADGYVVEGDAAVVAVNSVADKARVSFAFQGLSERDQERVTVGVFDCVLPELAKL
jgi:hypothetical protein